MFFLDKIDLFLYICPAYPSATLPPGLIDLYLIIYKLTFLGQWLIMPGEWKIFKAAAQKWPFCIFRPKQKKIFGLFVVSLSTNQSEFAKNWPIRVNPSEKIFFKKKFRNDLRLRIKKPGRADALLNLIFSSKILGFWDWKVSLFINFWFFSRRKSVKHGQNVTHGS